MATKLKSFSTNILTRAAAFALALLCLTLAIITLYDLALGIYQNEPESEALFTPNYEDSSAYYSWIDECLWTIRGLLESDDPAYTARSLQWLTDEGVLFRAQSGDTVYTNAEGYSAEDLTPSDGRWIASDSGEITIHLLRGDQPELLAFSAFYTDYYSDYAVLSNEGVSVQLFVPQSVINEHQAYWEQSRDLLSSGLRQLLLCAVPFLLLTVFLCVVTGRRPGDDALHAGRLDRVWTELLIAAWVTVIVLSIMFALSGLDNAFSWGLGFWSNRSAVLWLCSLILGAGYCLSMPLLLAMVRKVKARRFFRHSAVASLLRRIMQVCRGVVSLVRGLIDGSAFHAFPFADAMFRHRLAYVLGSLVCVLIFLFSLAAAPLFCALALSLEILITWWFLQSDNQTLQDMTRVVEQIDHIAGGDLSWQPSIPPGSQLAPVSRQLSEIGGGMQKSVEKQMQSERMKVELVTNVSHDLKTPLTSIISYVELLSKVEDLPPEARDYVAILAQKSDRLKSLVYDLFELAKSTSGSMEMQCEALDFHRLVEQTLAEMQERIDQSGLGLRVSLAEPPVTIWADGRKMYRVLQNIIDNALKYSLAGTRIYVDLTAQHGVALLTIKNTSGYEMDFSAEEITERFVRGDKARTAEGSGLGLSIAQSFTQACGGRLSVAIDGDQFKVFIRFDLYGTPPSVDVAPASDTEIL